MKVKQLREILPLHSAIIVTMDEYEADDIITRVKYNNKFCEDLEQLPNYEQYEDSEIHLLDTIIIDLELEEQGNEVVAVIVLSPE